MCSLKAVQAVREPTPGAALRPPARASLASRLVAVLALVFALVLGAGAAVVIHNARQAVSQELRSTANLALQLLEVASAVEALPGAEQRVLWGFRQHIRELERTRHLRIELLGSGGELLAPAPPRRVRPAVSGAPAWFAGLVRPDSMELRRSLQWPGLPAGELVIRPDPADEIAEAWEESWPLLALLATCFAACVAAVFIAVNRSLRPIEAIERALVAIEQGAYDTRVPPLRLPELDRIGAKIDHLAGVLERARADNRALVKRGLAIQEAERRYLAQELHDEMGQSISAIKAVAVSITQRPEGGDSQTRTSAGTIADICSRMHDVVRGLMRRLRPAALDELGLQAALENMVDDWNALHEEVFCSLEARALPPGLPEEVEIGIYRIVQECLTNVARHAGASRVDVSLRAVRGATEQGAGPRVLELVVRDDGVGLPDSPPGQGFGLRGMRERVEALGGHIELGNQGGAFLRVRLPLASEAVAATPPPETAWAPAPLSEAGGRGVRGPAAGLSEVDPAAPGGVSRV